jgi:hypothetical protein
MHENIKSGSIVRLSSGLTCLVVDAHMLKDVGLLFYEVLVDGSLFLIDSSDILEVL